MTAIQEMPRQCTAAARRADVNAHALEPRTDAPRNYPANRQQRKRRVAVGRLMMRLTPWFVSLAVHGGLVLLMLFVVMASQESRVPVEITIPDAFLSENPGGSLSPAPQEFPQSQGGGAASASGLMARSPAAAIPAGAGLSEIRAEPAGSGRAARAELIGVSGTGGASDKSIAQMDLAGSSPATASGPRSQFFGSGGNAHHVVYVIDRSGSMHLIGIYESVRKEMLESISRLRLPQDFHVILFSEAAPLENAPCELVPADRPHKTDVAEFLKTTQAEGQTDVIPALNRAFDVLEKSNRLGGKLIYLLTDGEFPDNEKVLAAIRARNPRKDVSINTYLYGHHPREAVEVMRKIAAENNGQYKYIPLDE